MFPRKSILLKLLLLTSSILIAVFATTGYLLSHSIEARATRSVQEEVVASFGAYESLWQEHTQNLRKISSIISRMPDVRAAFTTNDRATIQDTAGELWSHVASGNAVFTVADGSGRVIASLGNESPFAIDSQLGFLPQLTKQFPEQQTGFLQARGKLYQVVITPVYVDAANGKGLLTVLATGFELDRPFLRSLKQAAGGSDLIFKMRGRPLASTLDQADVMNTLGLLSKAQEGQNTPRRLRAGATDYLVFSRALPALLPGDDSELCIVRSLANSQQAVSQLLRRFLILWLAGLVAAILGTYAVVRRLVQPVSVLDRAASEIARGNYGVRVEAAGEDEIGRLARSFNTMCASLESARAELIRQERLTSVARLATFVAHDLRNPLASIYAGAEMLVDNDLPAKQVKRLARNMYNASRGVLAILGELLSAVRNKTPKPEACVLYDLVNNAWNDFAERGVTSKVQFEARIPPALELMLDRAPMERVFHNLLENALEAMDGAGKITVAAQLFSEHLLLHIEDSGSGIPAALRETLFQPFASTGRAEGLGLGLALSRQTLLAHGGDLWADFAYEGGSCFVMRLPLIGRPGNGESRASLTDANVVQR